MFITEKSHILGGFLNFTVPQNSILTLLILNYSSILLTLNFYMRFQEVANNAQS